MCIGVIEPSAEIPGKWTAGFLKYFKNVRVE